MKKLIFVIFVLLFFSATAISQDLTATEIVQKADNLQRGNSSRGTMIMKIIRPKWTREIRMKNWSLGRDYSMTYIMAPPKDKGQVFLKRKNEMWNWVPSISRMIKIPPSMMSQGWMGSDYTNDDILKESSIVVDYDHKLIGEEEVSGISCYEIEMLPKEEAAVVWGKVIKWISKEKFWQLKSEYFDEDGELIRTEIASKVKQYGDRKLPSHLEIIPADKPGQKTVVDVPEAEFNIKLEESFFSLQNMKRVR
jgi:outer membrane lipoprotein-sorting protein